jgi:hypothetical protein
VNQKLGNHGKVLEWQTGYGVVSFGTKDLPWVQAYVRNQREHHAKGTTAERLERVTAREETAEAEPREAPRTGLSGRMIVACEPAVNGGPNTAPRKAP